MEFPKSPDRIFLGIRAELELWWTTRRVWKGLNQETGTASWLLTTPYWSEEKRMSPAYRSGIISRTNQTSRIIPVEGVWQRSRPCQRLPPLHASSIADTRSQPLATELVGTTPPRFPP